MQLTKYTDHSFRVLMYLALLNPGELGTIATIAENLNMSRNHLVKVAHKLANLGYVTSVQGRGGGIQLAKSAKHITIGAVIRDMESTLDLIDCETKPCPILKVCELKKAVNLATNAFLATLDQYTIADITKQRTKLIELIG